VKQKNLEEKLSQVAEWVYPSVSLDNATERIIPNSGKKKYKKTFTPRPDMGPRIIKILPIKPCAWCGKDIEQRQNITKQVIPKRGDSPEIIKWNYSCYNCHRVWDPVTKQLQPHSKSLQYRNKKKLP
jgi:hypothetical protein